MDLWLKFAKFFGSAWEKNKDAIIVVHKENAGVASPGITGINPGKYKYSINTKAEKQFVQVLVTFSHYYLVILLPMHYTIPYISSLTFYHTLYYTHNNYCETNTNAIDDTKGTLQRPEPAVVPWPAQSDCGRDKVLRAHDCSRVPQRRPL